MCGNLIFKSRDVVARKIPPPAGADMVEITGLTENIFYKKE